MTQETICVQQEPVPVYGTTDVAMVGGGVAGISAAIAAARNGKKVTLVEKSCILGGRALGPAVIPGTGGKLLFPWPYSPLREKKLNQVINTSLPDFP